MRRWSINILALGICLNRVVGSNSSHREIEVRTSRFAECHSVTGTFRVKAYAELFDIIHSDGSWHNFSELFEFVLELGAAFLARLLMNIEEIKVYLVVNSLKTHYNIRLVFLLDLSLLGFLFIVRVVTLLCAIFLAFLSLLLLLDLVNIETVDLHVLEHLTCDRSYFFESYFMLYILTHFYFILERENFDFFRAGHIEEAIIVSEIADYLIIIYNNK